MCRTCRLQDHRASPSLLVPSLAQYNGEEGMNPSLLKGKGLLPKGGGAESHSGRIKDVCFQQNYRDVKPIGSH